MFKEATKYQKKIIRLAALVNNSDIFFSILDRRRSALKITIGQTFLQLSVIQRKVCNDQKNWKDWKKFSLKSAVMSPVKALLTK